MVLPVLLWLAPDHAYSLFLQGRPLDGLAAIAMYGAVFMGTLAYYRAEWDSVEARTLRRRGLLRGVVLVGSLSITVFLLPSGPAFRLARTASEGNVAVFLNASHLRPGKTVGAMIRVDLPHPTVCGITAVQLVWDQNSEGVRVVQQAALGFTFLDRRTLVVPGIITARHRDR